MSFNLDVLKIDPAQELERLSEFVVEQVKTFRKKGVVVGLSGGIDSACIAAVAVHALGKEKVVGLILPESESNPISSEYAIKHAQALGIEHRQIDITSTVNSIVKYKWRDEFLQKYPGSVPIPGGGGTRPRLRVMLRLGPEKLTLGSAEIYWYFRTFGRALLQLSDLW